MKQDNIEIKTLEGVIVACMSHSREDHRETLFEVLSDGCVDSSQFRIPGDVRLNGGDYVRVEYPLINRCLRGKPSIVSVFKDKSYNEIVYSWKA
jgi:hypothetical protein